MNYYHYVVCTYELMHTKSIKVSGRVDAEVESSNQRLAASKPPVNHQCVREHA